MKLKDIKVNPNNPRIIKDSSFELLKNSIIEFPKMMEKRPIIYDDITNYSLGGNQRLGVLNDIKKQGRDKLVEILTEKGRLENLEYFEPLFKGEIPEGWIIPASNFTEEEKQRFIVADNVEFGEFDFELLEMNWDLDDLADWGVEMPKLYEPENKEKEIGEQELLNECPKCGYKY